MWVIWYEYAKKLIKLENIQTFILSGRPRKGEYSGLTNAQNCKLWREKAISNDFLTRERERKRKFRAEMKKRSGKICEV